MKFKSKIYIWNKISFFSILFKFKSEHHYLHCNEMIFFILNKLNFKLFKINLDNYIFDEKGNNFFFKSDCYVDLYSKKILSFFKNNTFTYKYQNLVKKIYLSYIGHDIKYNLEFFIRTEKFFSKKFKQKKIFYVFDDTDFTNFLCKILSKKYNKFFFLKRKVFFRKNLFKKTIYFYFTFIFNIFKIKKIKKSKPLIFQEYISNIFDRYPNSGHLFWLSKSKIKFSDIGWFTFNRKSNSVIYNPITKKNEILNCIQNFNLVGFKDIFKDNFFLYIKKFSLKSFNYYNFYFLEFFIKYKIEHNKKLIEDFNVKILHHYQEPNYQSLSLSYSCKITNCVFIWNHWSVDQHPVYNYKYGFCDVLLSWGAMNTSYFNAHKFVYDYVFVTGMISGDNYNSIEKNVYRRAINVFDSTSNYECFHHPNFLREDFFRTMIDLVDHHKYKINIKPKGNNIFKNLSIKTQLKLKNLIKKKKIYLYSNKIAPSKIGNLNDLYIAWGPNTAGNIAHMHGKNVLYYDNTKLIFHPFYRKKFVLDDKKQLYLKINNFFYKKEKFKLKNNEKKYLNEFFDNKSNERAAYIFEKIFNNLKKMTPKKEVLESLKKNYQIKYGQEKLIAKKGSIKTLKIWEKEINKINQEIRF